MLTGNKLSWLKSIENIVTKEEIAPQEQLFLLSQFLNVWSAISDVKTH
jgi:hypothetical protein